MKAWITKQLTDGKLDFAKLERMIWMGLIAVFQRVMVEVLEVMDRVLMASRDTERYEHRDKKGRTLQTLVGSISFKRRYYWDHQERRHVFLLDQKLSLKAHERVSPGMVQLAVTWATRGPSYRDARDRLEELYGMQILSHEGIRQILMEVGEAAHQERANQVVRSDGKRRVEALFIEVDGFNAHLQSNATGKRKKRRRKEVKVAVVHEGWEVRQGEGEQADFRLKNPEYIPVFEESEAFWEHVRGYIAGVYEGVDNIPVIINGDGAEWIGPGAQWFRHGIYQYDRFHLVREIRDALRKDTKRQRQATQALKKEDTGESLAAVTEAREKVTDPKAIEKLDKVYMTLRKHHESIRDYRIRLREDGYEVDPSWRGLGAAESNMDKFENRVRKRGRAWATRGLRAILSCLSEHFKGTLPQITNRQAPTHEPWILDRIQTGAGHVAKKITQDHLGVRPGSFPATERGTQGYAKLFLNLLQGENAI